MAQVPLIPYLNVYSYPKCWCLLLQTHDSRKIIISIYTHQNET